MSAHSSSDPADHVVSTTGQDVASGKILSVGIVALVAFAVSAVVGFFIVRAERGDAHAQRGVPREAAMIGRTEIGIVDQVHYDADKRLEVWKAERSQRLGSYGWVDKDRKIAHVPIDKAMDEVVKSFGPGGQGR